MSIFSLDTVIIRSLVVEKERDNYLGDGAVGSYNRVDVKDGLSIEELTRDASSPDLVGIILASLRISAEDVKVKELHRKLTDVLLKHIWILKGIQS